VFGVPTHRQTPGQEEGNGRGRDREGPFKMKNKRKRGMKK
jgi:hypothetical protein